MIDIYGKNVVTLEGEEWKRHRKIVAPSFSKSCNLRVFKESIKQAEHLLQFWQGEPAKPINRFTVLNIASDTATLSLHGISACGFGIPQEWTTSGTKQGSIPGLNSVGLLLHHTLMFKHAFQLLLRNILWKVLLPGWMLGMTEF